MHAERPFAIPVAWLGAPLRPAALLAASDQARA